MKSRSILTTLFLLTITLGFSQESHVNYSIESQASFAGDAIPFWMRSNLFGSYPSVDVGGSVIGRIDKQYNVQAKTFDWGMGVEARANIGNNSKFHLIEGFAKFKASIFQLKAGRTKDVMGLSGDTLLSSGNFSVSGNALGIPKIEVSIPDYFTIPVWGGILSFKGNFSHGWIGRTPIIDTIRSLQGAGVKYATLENNPVTFFHQKSLYARLGKIDWRFKLYGGFNHQAFWGSERESMGKDFNLSPIETFFYVVTGQSYGSGKIPNSKIGNQLGSIDIGMEYDFSNIKLMLYRQNFYDVGALSKLANIRDGLTGVTVENKHYGESSWFNWEKILVEFLYTKNQAGELWSKPTKSGDEDYYNNYYYKKGWSYKNHGIGNPFITPKVLAKAGQASSPNDYFINNRVVALHAGVSFKVCSILMLSKMSFSKNYGTYGTSPEGHSTGSIRFPNTINLFKPVNQFSGYIEANKRFDSGLVLGILGALDRGHLLDNSGGLIMKVAKQF